MSNNPSSVNTKASPLQREFDRLVSRIEECRTLLTAWQQQPTASFGKYHAKMEPALRDLSDAQTMLIVQLDAILTSPSLPPGPSGTFQTAEGQPAETPSLNMPGMLDPPCREYA
ncbi:MAG: hypothetical protein ABL934_13100 [Lysobacteraceae bacterium]